MYLTAIGVEAKKYIDQGKLVPDELMIKFILNEIRNCHSLSWLLDGNILIIRSQVEAFVRFLL